MILLISLAKLAMGLLLLIGGAEFLTHHCIALARYLGVKPIIIGLTVVAFGTSAPEFFVSILANLKEQADLAVGNIIGSNIANIGLILGVAAIIRPFSVPKRIAKVELPFLVLSVILIGIASWKHILSRSGAFILIFSFAVYLYFLMNKRGAYVLAPEEEKVHTGSPRYFLRFGIIVLSFWGLIAGSHLLIEGAVSVARFFNCPELIIGLSLTAVGTSLPELASTISALRRNETGLVIGNVLGSNFANSCGILGFAALIKPIHINPHVLVTDFPAMAVFSLVLIPIFKNGYISRLEGIMLFSAYFCYLAIIYLKM